MLSHWGTDTRGVAPNSIDPTREARSRHRGHGRRIATATPGRHAVWLTGVVLALIVSGCSTASPASDGVTPTPTAIAVASVAPTPASVAVASVAPTPQVGSVTPAPTAVPTRPSRTPRPTPQTTPKPTPTPVAVAIDSPSDGDTVRYGLVTLSGTGPDGVELTVANHLNGVFLMTSDDIQSVTPVDGRWSTRVYLSLGANEITVGTSLDDVSDSITVYWELAPKPTATPTPAPTPKPVTYATLTSRQWAKVVKDPDAAAGKGYKVWACIAQFDAATGPSTFLAQTSYRNETYWWSDGDNAIFTGDEDELADYIEGDLVTMSVMTVGSFSYDTQAGGTATVPQFFIAKIQHKGSC